MLLCSKFLPGDEVYLKVCHALLQCVEFCKWVCQDLLARVILVPEVWRTGAQDTGASSSRVALGHASYYYVFSFE